MKEQDRGVVAQACTDRPHNYIHPKIILAAIFGAVAIAGMHYEYPIVVGTMCVFIFLTFST